jgi:hypothetical protein
MVLRYVLGVGFGLGGCGESSECIGLRWDMWVKLGFDYGFP